MSQECDLDLEFRARNKIAFADGKIPTEEGQITNILFCVVSTADQLRNRSDINGGIYRQIITNSHERYQYLHEVSENVDAKGEGLPYLAIDFRRHFTLTVLEVYAALASSVQRRCYLKAPYLEHLSARFSRYLGRVALPLDH